MRDQGRVWFRTVGSILVVLVVIGLVSSDTETMIALSAFSVVGYLLSRVFREADALRPVRARLTPGVKGLIGVVLVLGVVAAVADEVDVGIWMVGMAVTGYAGYRSGRVFRGALAGGVVGVAGAVLLVTFVTGFLLLVSVFDVGGSREMLYQVLFAPQVVGFFSLLWIGFIVVLAGGTGLVSGGLGGAVARLL